MVMPKHQVWRFSDMVVQPAGSFKLQRYVVDCAQREAMAKVSGDFGSLVVLVQICEVNAQAACQLC